MPRPKKILDTRGFPATWLLPDGLGDKIWSLAKLGNPAPEWFDGAVQSAVSEYLRYCSEIEGAPNPETYGRKVRQLCRLIDDAEAIVDSLSSSERAEVRAALPWPDAIRRNPFNPLNDSDHLLRYALQQVREFRDRLRTRHQGLHVLREEPTAGGIREHDIFERRFDRLVRGFIPIAERIPIKISASKDSSGVSPFVALIEASLKTYLEEHTDSKRQQMSEKYSKMYLEAGMEQEEIDRLSTIWDEGFDFGKSALSIHSSSTLAISGAISEALRRIGRRVE